MGRAVRAVGAVFAAVLALTGCAGQSPATAATVNQVVITETQVDQVAQALATIFESPEQAGAQRRLAATVLIGNEGGRAVGAERGVTISEDDRKGTIAQYTDLTALSEQPGMAQIVDDYAAALLIRTELGETDFATTAATIPVVVNPRYGSWDATLGQLETGSGSLSSPAPSPTANA